MKRTRVCTKCASSDVVRFDGSVSAHGAGNNILTGKSVFSAVLVNRYVCCSCGFVEEWVDKDDLITLKNSKTAR